MEDTGQIIQNEVMEKKTDLEPHILLLQEFLGQQIAERFLDPSYEILVSSVQPLHLETECCGAKEYWRLLREHSEAQLMQDIADVPGAFPVKSLCLSHLLQSKLLDQIKEYRRKLWLMSRSSEINQEKAILFLTNNPLPDVNEQQNIQFPVNYRSKDTYLTKKINQIEKSFHLPPLKTTNAICAKNKHISNVKTTATGNNYRFLTEETFHGFKDRFSKRCSETPLQISSLKDPYKHTTFNQPSRMHEKNESSCSTTKSSGGRHAWEPLTYTALLDSKPSLTVPGKGDFRHGQPLLWLVSNSTIKPAFQHC
ncbi:testis-specific gene 13 protein [Pyxicephalus adspersus]|uniref:testis-specific gene 13 protein n=1 Tax=Pyxicephalus adspersus TaxID=30357 RepID=UPI003B5AAFC5